MNMKGVARDRAMDFGAADRPLLVLSWGLPPMISGVSTVMSNLASAFSRDEMILAGERVADWQDFEWDDTWPEIHYLVSSASTKLRGERIRRWLTLPLLLARSVWLARRKRCGAVMAVFPDERYLLVGYLTARLTGAKLLPYFHNTYLENRKGWALTFARWLQGRVFARAAHVFVMSEGMAKLYRERYQGLRCSPLTHSFKEPPPDYTAPPAPGETLNLAICGTIWDVCLDATERVCAAVSDSADTRLRFYCGKPDTIAEFGLTSERITAETAPHGQLLDRLRLADVMVLPHGFGGKLSDEEYATIFPTRTIEYLWSGRPILAHTPRECFLTEFLTERECALVVSDPSVEALKEAFERLRTDADLRARLVRNALRTAQLFHAPAVARSLRYALAEINSAKTLSVAQPRRALS